MQDAPEGFCHLPVCPPRPKEVFLRIAEKQLSCLCAVQAGASLHEIEKQTHPGQTPLKVRMMARYQMLVGTQQDAFTVCQPKRHPVHLTENLHGLRPRVLHGEGIGASFRRPFRLLSADLFCRIGALPEPPPQIIQFKALFLRPGTLQRQETALDGGHSKKAAEQNASVRIPVKAALSGPEGKIGDIPLFQTCPFPPDCRRICRLFFKMPVQVGQDALPCIFRRASRRRVHLVQRQRIVGRCPQDKACTHVFRLAHHFRKAAAVPQKPVIHPRKTADVRLLKTVDRDRLPVENRKTPGSFGVPAQQRADLRFPLQHHRQHQCRLGREEKISPDRVHFVNGCDFAALIGIGCRGKQRLHVDCRGIDAAGENVFIMHIRGAEETEQRCQRTEMLIVLRHLFPALNRCRLHAFDKAEALSADCQRSAGVVRAESFRDLPVQTV